MGGVSKDIPDRWLEYTAVGRQIPRTRIICFKVPLKQELCHSLREAQRFTPSMLMKALPNLVGVIDVTNTPRYYNNQELLVHGIQHEKILCPGLKIPPLHVVNKFQSVMDSLWKDAESLGKLVGVHCTHGVNRTGYLVCRYMIECRGFMPEEAIKLFGESRGHPIERQNYLNDLMSLKPKQASQGTSNHAGHPLSGHRTQGMDAQLQSRWQRNLPDDEEGRHQLAGPSLMSNPNSRHGMPPNYSENRRSHSHSAFYPPMNQYPPHMYNTQHIYPLEYNHNHPPQHYPVMPSHYPHPRHSESTYSRNNTSRPSYSPYPHSNGKSYFKN